MKKFTGAVRFGNDHFGAIMGYGDYVIVDNVISRVYYVEGLGHNLFSVRQFCDSDLEVAFRKHSCYVKNEDGADLLKGFCGSNLYTISVEDMMKSSPICLLYKASKNKSCLWHRRLNHVNFGTINDLARKDLVRGLPRLKFEKYHLFSACQLGKTKKYTYKPKSENTIMEVLHTLHMDLCGLMRVVGIFHQKSVPRTPQQNGVVERQNRTLVEAARTMLIFSKALMFLWAEAVATAFFGALCYPTNDNEDLGKLKATTDIGIFVGYAPNRKGPKPILLMPGQISLGLVPNLVPATPYVPPTNKDLQILFQPMFDEYLEPPSVERLVPPAPAVQVPVISAVRPTIKHNPFAQADNDPFVNMFAPEPSSDESSFRDVSLAESTQVIQPHNNLRKWSKDHPLDNVIGNPSRIVSTKKQLATDSLWCLYNSVLSKVKPKNVKTAIDEACWFEVVQEEIHEFDQLQV
ncbi:retrovirus-related pol polyprotein from transposon TNT 1-94 [Tanacetum coccineum]